MNELRNGVKLKKTNHTKTPIEYALTPYEMLMDDIRSRRYKLNKVSKVLNIIRFNIIVKTSAAKSKFSYKTCENFIYKFHSKNIEIHLHHQSSKLF